MDKKKNFRVPNKDIKVELHELLLINSKVFQRLNLIKQLGLAYLVYPFALHTRGAHCLDCLDKAQMFIDGLKANYSESENIENRGEILKRLEEDSLSIRAGALLHDIMHIPFAHTLEDENNLFSKGDKSKRINIMLDLLKAELESQRSLPSLAIHRIYSLKKPENFKDAVQKCMNLIEDVRNFMDYCSS
jgi:HD superfamily phosphohydrolase